MKRPTLLVAAWLLVASAGCDSYVNTSYGTHNDESVNGVDVLSSLFTAAGHKTRIVRSRLTDRMQDRADAIVWIPDCYHLPDSEERAWLYDGWLAKKGGRTLIYVGRDYDAGPVYWQKMLQGAPADKVPEMTRRLSEAQAHAAIRRGTMPTLDDCAWYRFTHDGAAKGAADPSGRKAADRLAGEPKWTAGIDPAKLEIPRDSRLDPVFEADVVLELDGDVLVSRQRVPTPDGGTSQLIVVVNGSFLLNMGLVNHEHRKLAARLVSEITDPRLDGVVAPGATPPARSTGKQVYLVESDDEGLELVDTKTPRDAPETQKWPPERLRVTFLHLAALAIILIVSRWPIFGRPREERTTHEADFGRHVEALGDLMSRGDNVGDAKGRLERYQKIVQSEAAGKIAPRPGKSK